MTSAKCRPRNGTGRVRLTVSTYQKRRNYLQHIRLLYRLCLIGRQFGDPQVAVVSIAEPPIPSPGERFHALTGLWVQQEQPELYTVSPLVGNLPALNLSSGTMDQVHLGLAAQQLARKTLGPIDVLSTFGHLTAARHIDRAASVLLIALNAIALADDPMPDDWGLALIWGDIPIPAEVNLNRQLILRACQVVIALRQGRDVAYVLAEFDRLLALEHDNLVEYVTSSLVLGWLTQRKPELAGKYALKALTILRKGLPSDVPVAPETARTLLLQLFWAAAVYARSAVQIAAWFDLLRQLTPVERVELTAFQQGDEAAALVTSRIWLDELDRRDEERDWNRVQADIWQIIEAADDLWLVPLKAHGWKARIIVYAEVQNQLETAVGEAEQLLKDATVEARTRFLVSDTIARQLYRVGQFDRSLNWWDAAVDARQGGQPAEVVDTVTYAIAAAGQANDNRVQIYRDTAIDLLQDLAGRAWPIAVRGWGERAIAYWLAGDLLEAYRHWGNAVRVLFEHRELSSDWKILLRVIGNCSTYFTYKMKPSPEEWPYAVPRAGLLLEPFEALVASYHPMQDWMLLSSVAVFADRVGQWQDAANWGGQAQTIGKKEDRAGFLFNSIEPNLWLYELPRYLEDGRVIDALKAAVTLSNQPTAFVNEPSSVPLDQQVKMLSWNRQFAAEFTVFAVAIAIFRVSLRDQLAGVQLAGSAQTVSEKLIENSQNSVWTKSCELFGYLAGHSTNWREMYNSGRALTGDVGWFLGMALYLSAGLFATPMDAWRLQLAFLPSFESAYAATEEDLRSSILGQPRRSYYQSLVCSAVVEFWAANISETAFYYRNPRVAQEALKDANAICDVCARMRKVLIIVTVVQNRFRQREDRALL